MNIFRVLFAAMMIAALSASAPRAAEYNLYFGGTHAHTSFSDGSLLPENAYDMARKAGMDFWFLTEHYHEFAYVKGKDGNTTDVKEWAYELEKSKKKTQEGKFLALLGWEWSDGINGHINVLFDNTEPPPFLMTAVYSRFLNLWVKKHPRALIGLNHPQWSKDHKMNNFNDFEPVPGVASQTVYIEVAFNEDIPYYYRALDRGWRLAPVGPQDNHQPDWGMLPYYTGVYAKALTAGDLYDAFAARRFYSATTPKFKLWFEANGSPMGSVVKGEKVSLKIDAGYENNPGLDSVKLVTNEGKVVSEWKPGAAEFHQTVEVPVSGPAWYVVHAAASDGMFAVSAPVWVSPR